MNAREELLSDALGAARREQLARDADAVTVESRVSYVVLTAEQQFASLTPVARQEAYRLLRLELATLE